MMMGGYDARCRGVVKKWRADKGWGFLVAEGNDIDIYVSRSGLASGFSDLHPGDEVSFAKEDDQFVIGRPRAVDVKVVRPANGSLLSKPKVAADEGGVQCTGVVKRWLAHKGFGFVIPDGGGDDVYVHQTGLLFATELSAGDTVSFVRLDGGKGRGSKAIKVVVTAAGTAGSLFADLPEASEESSNPHSATGLDLFLEFAGEASASARVFMEPFLLMSSLKCPFLVLSDSQLVHSIRAPTPDEYDRLAYLVTAFITGCEIRRAVMLVDFEGEMLSYGGELATAQLQFFAALDAETLVPRPLPRSQRFTAPGLLIDLRSPRCVDVLRQVLESSKITKLVWGADGDCQSLLYQAVPIPLGIQPAAIVDVQVAFDSNFRLGMATMLQYVPAKLLEGLPTKEQIDWDSFHCKNCRAMPMPLSQLNALYAVDDLHRMEAILASKLPPGGSYAAARTCTEQMLAGLRADPYGLQVLRQDLKWLEKRDGIKRVVKAVQIARHLYSLRARGADVGEANKSLLLEAVARAQEELQRAGTVVASDLSFNEHVPEPAVEAMRSEKRQVAVLEQVQ